MRVKPTPLGDLIRSEAAIADRPGQMGRLTAIAYEVDRLLDLAQRAEADRAAVERVRRVSEYWDLSEFPHEATATAMRSELIAALDAKADQ